MSEAQKVRGLILDYGEVICNRPRPGRMERMAEASGLALDEFRARYNAARNPYDRGDVTPFEYWSKVLDGTTVLSDTLLDNLRKWDVEMWSDLNPAMTVWIDQVHEAGYRTALLSNMHIDMAAHARSEFDWLRRMDFMILSCEVRLIKPERAIYEQCVEGLGVAAGEACFIDDREINVTGARDAGLQAVRFAGVEQLHKDLGALGIPVLPRC